MVPAIPRIYDALLEEHCKRHRQMAFVAGPRQVGKTTTCRKQASAYLNWDDLDDRRLLLGGPAGVAAHLGLAELREAVPVVVLDELHKYGRWKTFLKGFFDTYGDRVRLLVTGSSRLDVYRRGGDSLMGRYLLYRMHPLSVGELLRQDVAAEPLRKPAALAGDAFDALLTHGGYPEPFLTRDRRLTTRPCSTCPM